MLLKKYYFLLFIFGFIGVDALAVTTPFSQYGQITNVMNTPNTYYTGTKFSKPIYAQGTDLNTGDCQRVLNNSITTYCSTHNKCKNMRLSDIRPAILIQLSQIPNHNYATECSGFLDSAFNNYKMAQVDIQNTIATGKQMPIQPTSFPTVTPKQTNNNWMSEYAEREQELAEIQKQLPSPGIDLQSKTEFPKTFDDASYEQRVETISKGLEPYKDKSAYVLPKFEKWETYTERKKKKYLDSIAEEVKALKEDIKKLEKCKSDCKTFKTCSDELSTYAQKLLTGSDYTENTKRYKYTCSGGGTPEQESPGSDSSCTCTN